MSRGDVNTKSQTSIWGRVHWQSAETQAVFQSAGEFHYITCFYLSHPQTQTHAHALFRPKLLYWVAPSDILRNKHTIANVVNHWNIIRLYEYNPPHICIYISVLTAAQQHLISLMIIFKISLWLQSNLNVCMLWSRIISMSNGHHLTLYQPCTLYSDLKTFYFFFPMKYYYYYYYGVSIMSRCEWKGSAMVLCACWLCAPSTGQAEEAHPES